MFIAMNRFKIVPGKEEQFEKVWRERDTLLSSVPGFTEFHLVKGKKTDEFSLYGFEKLIPHRRPIYDLIAKNWGIEIPFTEISKIKSASHLNKLIYQSLPETKD